jgi:hypothetical protein
MPESFSTSVSSEGVAANLDQQLRELVAQQVLRLRVHARRASISASVPQLENNRVSISLDRLQRFAEDFGVHVTDLLAPPDAPPADAARPPAFRNASSEGIALVVGAATPPW